MKLQYRPQLTGLYHDGEPTWGVQYSVFGIFWRFIYTKKDIYFTRQLQFAKREHAVARIKYIIDQKKEERERKYIG